MDLDVCGIFRICCELYLKPRKLKSYTYSDTDCNTYAYSSNWFGEWLQCWLFGLPGADRDRHSIHYRAIQFWSSNIE